jgi:hypothetical protein
VIWARKEYKAAIFRLDEVQNSLSKPSTLPLFCNAVYGFSNRFDLLEKLGRDLSNLIDCNFTFLVRKRNTILLSHLG